ncbi:Ig-like domain-containing protein [Trichlorobacter ammonificans]|uniref:Tandem-95 repeat protein n=1 Tax=Trichlorobacter ammonificans TaxID=2916410 RepID=A0ABM9D864_9BACT|nr:Ig-like domain-containing protein [Trichlorobacter ammonificans]CAH2031347.1 exported protein of unknown function [Trichlorobacter ammonificans]
MKTLSRIRQVVVRTFLPMLVVLLCMAPSAVRGATPQPLVAVHVSELTQALETMPSVPPSPSGAGTTGYQWWYTTWRYFVAAESLKEALASDGTPYVTVSDADITAGKLRNADGTPRYPILISLAAEAIDDSQITPLREYVNAGGFLLVGSSSFTRRPDGSYRGNFVLSTEMGVKMTYSSPSSSNDWNWYGNSRLTKATDHRLTSHIPSGTLIWGAPFSVSETPWGVSPQHPVHQMHLAWRVTGNGATVLANGIVGPLWTVNPYGAGQILFNGQMQPLIGHGASDPTMYSYVFFRRAIEWAFESFKLPLVRLSPWRYPYDAAFMVRHDFENSQSSIRAIESSAQFEKSLGAKGDYYFCTGTLRDEMGADAAVVASLRSAVSNYGATIGSHNGGLKNPVNGSLVQSDYDYWHWGPDEALDVTPSGYASGTAYATASLLKSFTDIEGWLSGLDNGRSGCGALKNCPRTWASPYFNATREASRGMLEQLNLVVVGEQKLGPFPARTISYTTAGKRFSPVSLPVSDWFVGVLVAQSTEGHTVSSIRAGIDFYYNLGALINFYTHQPSSSGGIEQEYITYGMTKTRIWSGNAVEVSDWWRLRAAVSVTPTATTTSDSYVINATVSGATDPDTAVELAIPSGYSGTPLIYLNGQPAAATEYRTTTGGVKIRVGNSVTLVRVQNTLNQAPVAVADSYSTNQNTALTVAAPGLLANDSDPEGSTLTAQKVTNPSHGTLSLNSNGSFTYTPTTGYSGSDSFTYRASDGPLTSAITTVSIAVKANQAPVAVADSYSTNQNTALTVAAPGLLANDSDPEGSALTAQKVTNPSHGTLSLNSNGSFTYTPTTGYSGSDSFTYRVSDGSLTSSAATVSLTVIAVNQAPVAVNDSYSTNQNTALTVAAPGLLANDSDPEGSALTAQKVTNPSHGTLSLNSNGSFTYTPTTGYSGSDSFTYRVSDGSLTSSAATVSLTVIAVNQAPVAVADSYSTNQNTALTVAAPGLLANDSDPEGSALTAQKVTNPSHGTLSLNSNGSFTYTPTTGYSGSDSFTYRVSDGSLTSSAATVSLTVIAVNQAPVAVNDSYSTNQNTALTVAAPGLLVNDSDPEGSTLTAQLVSGPSYGTLSLNSNGSFTYTPTTGYSGSDSFTYKISDGSLTSESATVSITVIPVSSSLFSDDFTRTPGQVNPLLPWTVQAGTWSVDGNGVLRGSGATMNYGYLYTVPDPEWRNYSVEAQFQFPSGAFGGGIGGKLNPGTGEHYGAWIYPDGSIGGSNTLKLVKFRSWTGWSGTPMGQVNLSSVGTGWHTVKLVFSGTRIQVYYDDTLKIDVTDNNFDSRAPYGTGGISVDSWTYTGSYTMGVDNVVVSATQ